MSHDYEDQLGDIFLYENILPFEKVSRVNSLRPILVNKNNRFIIRSSTSLIRHRANNESSPLKYQIVRIEFDGKTVGRRMYWLPPNLSDSVDELDFNIAFPSLPTYEELEQAKLRLMGKEE
uniref:hypothetical protein n=1 Tax=Thaumasiovibrio subtropicus TaxID=1891207 RepID=UPI000B359042|nr:hypothetical protein [Thaumasiovibrio subtropicus]